MHESVGACSEFLSSSSIRGLELLVACNADVMGLQPVENLFFNFISESLSCHSCFVDKEFHDEDLCETVLQFFIRVVVLRRELPVIYLRAT